MAGLISMIFHVYCERPPPELQDLPDLFDDQACRRTLIRPSSDEELT